MTRYAMPFRTIPETVLKPGSWSLMVDKKKHHQLPQHLEKWDYNQRLSLSRKINIDEKIIHATTGLALDEISCYVRVGTGAGNIPRKNILLWEKALLTSGSLSIELDLDSINLTAQIHLETLLVLNRNRNSALFSEAKNVGEKLWSDDCNMTLERNESAFPMEATSFNELFHNEPFKKAPWYLHWVHCDPSREFRSAVRLFINTDIPKISGPLIKGDPVMLQLLMNDISSQIVAKLLRETASDESTQETTLRDSAEGSLGYYVCRILLAAFDESDESEAREMLNKFPGKFRARLMAASEQQIGAGDL